jgi:D-amino peptidase
MEAEEAMKIFISADMDGCAGVAVPRQCDMDNPDYELARRLMTDEVNAAISGAFDAGATEVLVNDSHSQQINLLPDRMDKRAELILGRPKRGGMFAGIDADYAGAMCIGYHAGASRHGVLAHTVDGAVYAAIRVNGIDCAEATLYGGYAGSMGVPVILLAGDDQLKEQCEPQFPGVRCVVVKKALGNRAARSLAPEVACSRIRAAAEDAVRNRASIKPLVIPGPYRVEMDLMGPVLADVVMNIPMAERVRPCTVALPADTMAGVIGWVGVVNAMSATLKYKD